MKCCCPARKRRARWLNGWSMVCRCRTACGRTSPVWRRNMALQYRNEESMYKVWVGVNMPDDVFAMLEEEVEVIGPRSDPTPPDSIEGVEEADAAIICPIFPANMATFEKLPRLRVVTRTGAGYDNVDVSAATACGICVVRTPDSNTESTAVYTIGMMLNAVRRIKLGDRLLARGEWLPLPQVDSFDLNGAMLGIIGLGRIGGRVAEIAHVLGMRVTAYDPYIDEGRAVSLRTRL